MEKLIKPMLEEIYKHNSKWAIVLQDDSVQLHSVTGIMTAVCVTLAVCYSSAMKTARHITCHPRPKSQLPESATAELRESFLIGLKVFNCWGWRMIWLINNFVGSSLISI